MKAEARNQQVYPRYRKASKGQLVHRLIAAKALGKPLPQGVVVHHVNEDGLDNRNENLVICPNDAYHRLLHTRTQALEATGNPDSRMCIHCKAWDAQSNLLAGSGGFMRPYVKWYHRECRNKYTRNVYRGVSNAK